MTKKGVLGILKNYGNFLKRTPDEFYHLKHPRLKESLKHPTLFFHKKVFNGITKQKCIYMAIIQKASN